jgi:hypothetical protein
VETPHLALVLLALHLRGVPVSDCRLVGGDDEPSESCGASFFLFFLLIRHLRSMQWRSLNEALCPARIDLRSTEAPK